jgi:hypothetical protein
MEKGNPILKICNMEVFCTVFTGSDHMRANENYTTPPFQKQKLVSNINDYINK